MAGALGDQGLAVEKAFFLPASIDGIGRLANLLTRTLDLIRGESHPHEISVSLACFARSCGGMQAPIIAPLLPLNLARVVDLRPEPSSSRSQLYFSIPSGDLFKAQIREHLLASLFRASAEALATENAARFSLMQ